METNDLKKNIIYSLLYQITIIFVPLATSPYVSRKLGVEQIGLNSWINSITTYFILFGLLGVNFYGSRSVAYIKEDKEKISKVFWSIYVIQFFMLSLMLMGYYLYINNFLPTSYRKIGIIQSIFILANLVDITWFFSGMENFKLISIRNCVIKLLGLILIFVCVKTKNDLWKYILIISGTSFLGQLTLWLRIIRDIKFVKINLNEIVVHIKPIIVLFFPVLAISIFTNMDKFMIGEMSSIYQNGYYENAIRIIAVPKGIISALGGVMLPRTSNLIARGEEEKSKKYIQITVIYTEFISSAFMFGLAAVADFLAIILWGKDFYESGVLISFLTLSVTLSVLGNIVRTQYLIPHAKDREYSISLILGAVGNFVINFLLIPRIGALGAVIGTILAEFIITGMQIYYINNEINFLGYLKEGIIFYIFGLIMYILIIYVKSKLVVTIFSLIFLIILGAFLYLGLVIVYLVISNNKQMKEIRKLLLKILKNIL